MPPKREGRAGTALIVRVVRAYVCVWLCIATWMIMDQNEKKIEI